MTTFKGRRRLDFDVGRRKRIDELRGLGWLLAYCNDWRDEAVAVAGNSFDESGIFRAVIESGAKFLEDHIKAAIEVDKRAFRPKMSSQLIAADDFTGTLKQD